MDFSVDQGSLGFPQIFTKAFSEGERKYGHGQQLHVPKSWDGCSVSPSEPLH